jgi:hypothetical protein
MSEPTIKPMGRICLECKASEADDHWYKCSHYMAPDDLDTGRVNVYTHDDLGAVAREARESAWPKYADYGSGIDVEYTETPEAVVERLTGVKR